MSREMSELTKKKGSFASDIFEHLAYKIIKCKNRYFNRFSTFEKFTLKGAEKVIVQLKGS